MRILLIEDDEYLCKALVVSFKAQGFETDYCLNGVDGCELAKEPIYDIIILDRMLPQMDGLTTLKNIRSSNCKTPVIMLTALGQIHDRIDGLDAGADDYVTKPFDTNELIARIRAVLRRPATTNESIKLTYEDITLNCSEHLLCKGDEVISLTQKEYLLLEILLQNSNRLVHRELLLGKVWGMQDIVEEANLDTYIYFLRKRLKQIKSKVIIETVRGSGYRVHVKDSNKG